MCDPNRTVAGFAYEAGGHRPARRHARGPRDRADCLGEDVAEIGDGTRTVPKEQPIIVVCGDGERSREVAEKLTSDGRQASAISGGMDAWLSAGFHVQPSPDPDPRRDEASG
jgi:rhodanese-related sulfurtransferase